MKMSHRSYFPGADEQDIFFSTFLLLLDIKRTEVAPVLSLNGRSHILCKHAERWPLDTKGKGTSMFTMKEIPNSIEG